jgi:hypothetical protein
MADMNAGNGVMSHLGGMVQCAAERLWQRSETARDILAEMGARSVQSFNDDDLYVIVADTKQLVRTIRSRSHEATAPNIKPGEIAIKGMYAKRLGIWYYPGSL